MCFKSKGRNYKIIKNNMFLCDLTSTPGAYRFLQAGIEETRIL